jgi:hypothetical protein
VLAHLLVDVLAAPLASSSQRRLSVDYIKGMHSIDQQLDMSIAAGYLLLHCACRILSMCGCCLAEVADLNGTVELLLLYLDSSYDNSCCAMPNTCL